MYFFKSINFYLRNVTCDSCHCQSPQLLQSPSPLQVALLKELLLKPPLSLSVHNSFGWASLISTWMWTCFKNSPPELTWNALWSFTPKAATHVSNHFYCRAFMFENLAQISFGWMFRKAAFLQFVFFLFFYSIIKFQNLEGLVLRLSFYLSCLEAAAI